MKKNKIRQVIIISLFALLIISAAMHFSLEPADYKVSMKKDVVSAKELINSTVVGNDNGQYSEHTVALLQESVDHAEEFIGDTTETTIETEKNEYSKLKDAIKVFKKSANKNSLSIQEIEKLKEDGKNYAKDITLDDKTTLAWDINGKAIGDVSAVNLDVSYESLNQEDIDKILQTNGMKGTVLSFRHMGTLPCFAKISTNCETSFENTYLHYYDKESQTLTCIMKIPVDEGKGVFSIDRGGDWVIANNDITIAAAEAMAENIETEDGVNGDQTVTASEPSSDTSDNTTNKPATSNTSGSGNTSGSSNTSGSGNTSGGSNSSSGSGSSGIENPPPPPVDNNKYCTISIRCDTILNNMDKLRPGLESYVPSNGTILGKTKVKIFEGESVFEVLKRVTRDKRIQMEFRNDPTYSGAYIEGINHLYEFDCGNESGWMYKVNGWFPNYGCSRYKVKDGEEIMWVYTCDIGRDVGDQYYDTH